MIRRRAGMTLLEVTVALAVAGAALAAGASVLGFLTDQQDRTGAQALASASAERAALREWTGGAQVTTQGDAPFAGRSCVRHPDDACTDDEFTFVTSTPTDVATDGTIVHLFMVHDISDPARGLVADITPWRHPRAPVRVSVAQGASGFHARYLASVFGVRAWQANWVTSSVLPAAVELRVEYDSVSALGQADRAAHALLAVPMTIMLGARR